MLSCAVQRSHRRKPTNQPPRPVRIACPRFPAPMREALRWDRGVRTYDDLQRLYANRLTYPFLASPPQSASACLNAGDAKSMGLPPRLAGTMATCGSMPARS